MLQEQFYFRILLIIVLGVVYVWTMVKMAQYKPNELANQRNIIMKVFGGLFLLLGIVEAGLGVYFLTQVTHPSEMLIPLISPDGIYRSSSSTVYWGYVTAPQRQVILMITNAMTSIGWAAYFLFFKRSSSKWWKKILKFLFGSLLYAFYIKSSDFHYFDIWELLPLIFYISMVIFVNERVKKSLKTKELIPNIDKEKMDISSDAPETDNTKEEISQYMPKAVSEEVNEINSLPLPQNEETKEEMPTETKTSSEANNFCRYCGKRIDYDRVKYCKYCGKLIG